MLLIGGKDEVAENIKDSIWRLSTFMDLYSWTFIGNLRQVNFKDLPPTTIIVEIDQTRIKILVKPHYGVKNTFAHKCAPIRPLQPILINPLIFCFPFT